MDFVDDDQDSFVVVEDTPEETIGQLSLENLTVDQAVYTIGTLTQRIEQLTAAMDQINMTRSGKEPSLSSSFQEVRSLRPKLDSSVQTDEPTNGIDAAIEATPVTVNVVQQTSVNEHEMPRSARDTISDLETAMERLSAEKVTYLTCLAERDRRLNTTKEELRKAKTERATMEEVLESHTRALEQTEVALSEAKAELSVKDEIVRQLEADLAASKEEAMSLRCVAQMVMDDKAPTDAVMVDPNQSPIPSISYPYHSVPQDRRQW